MNQSERRIALLQRLLSERPQVAGQIPESTQEQKKLLRALLNTRMPQPVSKEFLTLQDDYLQAELAQKGVTSLETLTPEREHLYLWQGDITTLQCGTIVNAANSQMLGCFCPCHGCIDNAIHTFAGVQLRLACAELMRQQGHEEATGQAKITPAFNLPCRYVIHTVGPIVSGPLTPKHCEQLADCYRSCLKLACEQGIDSIAFCCISTGEFHFPNERAAEIAVHTTEQFLRQTNCNIKVIFNVFKDKDYAIYRKLLKPHSTDAKRP